MVRLNERWWTRPQIWVEAFVILNVGFLTFDIYLAHSVNQFRNHAEYIPLFFSACAPLVLVFALSVRYRWPAVWKDLGYLVGWIAVLVGLTGVILHLESHFFYERTLQSLTYSAPFAAPLAYTGPRISADHEPHGRSRVGRVGAMGSGAHPRRLRRKFHLQPGGPCGKWILQSRWNGCRSRPVPLPIGFMAVPLFMRVSRQYIDLCAAILLVEAGVGLWGFVLHADGQPAGPVRACFRQFHSWRSPHGSAALSQPHGAGHHRPVATPAELFEVTCSVPRQMS